MANQYQHLLTAIDVGSAKTCALAAEITDSGLRYRGHGVAESRGSRKGVIVELDKAVGAIQKAVEQAEDIAGVPIERALLGVSGAHVRGVNSHGGLSFGNRAREIGRDEIRSAVEKARAIPLPSDREILHLLPQEFILDDQAGVHDPLGMMGSRLEVRVHMVTAASGATQNVVTAVNRAGVHVDDTIFEPLACADSVLRADEREMGVCLADVGAGSTSLIVFLEGAVAHTAVVPIGGDHFTSDLAVGLLLELCLAGTVLSGGASRLPGLLDIAESTLRCPVRLSWPTPLAKMPAVLAEPEYATVIGMIFYGHRARMARGMHGDGWSSKLKAMLVGKGA